MLLASHLPSRFVFVAVSAAAHVAAFGALRSGTGRGPAPIDGATVVAIEAVAVDSPPSDGPPEPAPVAPGAAIVSSQVRPAAVSGAHDRAPRPNDGAPSAPAPDPAADAVATSGPTPAVPAPSHPRVFVMVVQSGTPAAIAPAGDVGAPNPGSASAPFAESDVSAPARRLGPLDAAYPAEARAQEIEGDVVLSIVVDATGNVADARIVRSAGAALDRAALHAVRASRFSPAVRGDRPVAVRMQQTVSFVLD